MICICNFTSSKLVSSEESFKTVAKSLGRPARVVRLRKLLLSKTICAQGQTDFSRMQPMVCLVLPNFSSDMLSKTFHAWQLQCSFHCLCQCRCFWKLLLTFAHHRIWQRPQKLSQVLHLMNLHLRFRTRNNLQRDGNGKLSWGCWTFWGIATFHPPYPLISWWVLFQVLQHPFNCLFMTGKSGKGRLLGNLQAQSERIRNAIRIAKNSTLSLSDGITSITSLSWSAWVQK